MDRLDHEEVDEFTRMALFLARYADGNMATVEIQAFHECMTRFAEDADVPRGEIHKISEGIMAETQNWTVEQAAAAFMKDAQELKEQWLGKPRLRRYFMDLLNLARADGVVTKAEQFVVDELARIWEITDFNEEMAI